jgi:hypothetical protein
MPGGWDWAAPHGRGVILYARPFAECTIYELTPGEMRRQRLRYDTAPEGTMRTTWVEGGNVAPSDSRTRAINVGGVDWPARWKCMVERYGGCEFSAGPQVAIISWDEAC